MAIASFFFVKMYVCSVFMYCLPCYLFKLILILLCVKKLLLSHAHYINMRLHVIMTVYKSCVIESQFAIVGIVIYQIKGDFNVLSIYRLMSNAQAIITSNN